MGWGKEKIDALVLSLRAHVLVGFRKEKDEQRLCTGYELLERVLDKIKYMKTLLWLIKEELPSTLELAPTRFKYASPFWLKIK